MSVNVIDVPIDQVALMAQAKGNMNKTFSEKVLQVLIVHAEEDKKVNLW